MTKKYISIFLVALTLIHCKTGNMGKVKYGEGGTVVSGESKTRCTSPSKRYTKAVEVKVKAEMDTLSTLPFDALEVGLNQSVTRLADYTSQGLDVAYFLFQICEMANNRGFTNEQINNLIAKALNAYNSNEEVKKTYSLRRS